MIAAISPNSEIHHQGDNSPVQSSFERSANMDTIILEEKPAAGVIVVNGKDYMTDDKGSLVQVAMIKPAAKLEDEVVRKVIGYAGEISAQIARFRLHCMDDLDGFDDLLAQEYGAKKGGAKGNRTYQSFDGLLKVQVAINDFEEYGPQLQQAKALIVEYLNEITSESSAEIQAIITKAFNTDKAGKVDRAEIQKLTKLDIQDHRWKEAMRAIEDARRVTSSKQYVRFYQRTSLNDPWLPITVDMAKA